MLIRRALRVALVLAALFLIAPPAAHAYLDPGTGSMLVSAVIGLFAAVGLALKMFWYRLVGMFRGKGRDVRPGEVKGPPATGE